VFTEVDLINFFSGLGVQIPGHENTHPDEKPDRGYAVGVSGGLGLLMDDQEEVVNFQILTRGPSAFDTPDAGTICSQDANEIDRLWINYSPRFILGPVYVKGKGRFTGPPAFVTVDDRRRTVRAATYWVRIVRLPGLLP
jgi:hypothetical protein